MGHPNETKATWHIRGIKDVSFGDGNQTPVPGDYNGDGKADIATYSSYHARWHIRRSGSFTFGKPNDLAAPADYNGDGKTDPAVLRLLDTYEWVARGLFDVRFGRFGDVPLAPLPLRCANYRQCFI